MSKTANRRKKTIRSGMASSSKTRPGVVRQIEKAKPAELSKPTETAKTQSLEKSLQPKNEGLAGASLVTNQERSEQIRKSILIVFSLVLSLVIGISIGSRDKESIVDSAIDLLSENAPSELSRQVLERAAIEGALKASGDQWANYFPSSAIATLEERNSNVLTGIGVTLKKSRSGAIEIVQVVSGTTAERAGLLSGDQIIEVNETDVQGASLTTVGALIRGEIGR
ncbi:MAG: S41 family peptidase, partial [Actinomycetota bacterium]